MHSEREADRLIREPGYTVSFDTAIRCLRDEANYFQNTRIARASMLSAIAGEIEAAFESAPVVLEALRNAEDALASELDLRGGEDATYGHPIAPALQMVRDAIAIFAPKAEANHVE